MFGKIQGFLNEKNTKYLKAILKPDMIFKLKRTRMENNSSV